MYRITSHVKVSIEKTRFDDLELQVFEDELKHLDRDEYEKAPELKFRSINREHALCHMDCIKVRKKTGQRVDRRSRSFLD